ncbi:MAG: hypothetical protein GY947_00735 [Rhodobacteraceae bacterium]|nr:hypothetical protein [Paracoccaceae bacterium]
MATTIISGDEVVTQTLGVSDNFVLLEGGTITVSSGDGVNLSAVTNSNIDLHIAGDIFSQSNALDIAGDQVGDATGSGNHDIYIASTGSLASLDGNGIVTWGGNNLITNFGEISVLGATEAGVINIGNNLSLRNFGSIMGGDAVKLSSANVTDVAFVENAGIIQGEGTGIDAGVTLELINSGLISANDDDGNSGGVTVSNINGTQGSVIINTGTISGQTNSVFLVFTDDLLVNKGLLIGNVLLNSGTDVFDGRGGSLIGTVFGGLGDDTFIVDDATIALSENAAEGTDTVKSTVSFTLGDNFENLTLIGSSNINGYGNSESNTITGNQGDNKLTGRGGADTLFGGSGED